jgi:copper(I)-binding protein
MSRRAAGDFKKTREHGLLNWFRRDPRSCPVTVGELEIGEGWARSATHEPPRVGGYFVVTNKGETADRLVSASSPLAGTVEIHAIKVVDADIRMLALPDGLVVPPDSTLTFRPRGYHLLLSRLKEQPAVGARLSVTLCFEKAGSVDIELAVAEPGLVGPEILDIENHRR